ncbi:MAG: hypothetical protein ACFB00_05970 [Parvularculaceae bacterium]
MPKNRSNLKSFVAIVALSGVAGAASAGEVDVIDATARQAGDGSWTISATLRHGDEGWDHYANRWEVVGPDGEVIAVRELAHPHVNEQPFTRSLGGVRVPDGVDKVTIRANDSVHGGGGGEFELVLSR